MRTPARPTPGGPRAPGSEPLLQPLRASWWAVDGSACSAEALTWALRHALLLRAEVDAVGCWQAPVVVVRGTVEGRVAQGARSPGTTPPAAHDGR